jgi:hypothetical protein
VGDKKRDVKEVGERGFVRNISVEVSELAHQLNEEVACTEQTTLLPLLMD